MREYATPRTSALPTGTLTDDVVRNAEEAPEVVALSRRGEGTGDASSGDTSWEDVTAVAFRDEVADLARGLVAAGVAPGDRVALVSRTRWEWTVVDYAVWWAGAVSVPVYATAPGEQLAGILRDAGVTAAVLESVDLVDRLRRADPRAAALATMWVIDEGGLESLRGLGRAPAAPDAAAMEQRRRATRPDDLATILYTSGTTGVPRGCEITHANLLAGVDACLDGLPELFADEDASTLLFLPLSHVLARTVQVGCVRARVRLAHGHDVRRLVDALGEVRPTFVLAVPRVFEQLFNSASLQAAADGRGRLFERATEAAISWSRARERGRVPVRLRARRTAYLRLVHARLQDDLGGRCRHAICGGAPLGERLGHFYAGIGIDVLEGYGLTETSGAVSVNQPAATRIGTVGRPLPGTAVRISDAGELLVRGAQVFRGYHRRPEETAQVLDPDGWLHTGDLGEVDDEGFVRVTGRQQEILVTAGGKSVAPSVLEDAVRAHPLVSQCLVVGDGRPFVAALVTLDADAASWWAERRALDPDPARLCREPDLVDEIQAGVDQANLAVSKAESIRRFEVLGRDWSEEGGELTPSLKLRRSTVLRRHREQIERLYDR